MQTVSLMRIMLESDSNSSVPAVSVVIPTYRRYSKLERAVNSVCEQTYKRWNLYVINDDPANDVSSSLPSDDRITYIQHEKNRGAPAARNTGIQVSGEPYIAFLDDDDAWKPEKLERQINSFRGKSDDFGLVYTGTDILKNGTVINTRTPGFTGGVYNQLLTANFIPSNTPLVRRKCFENVGLFDTDFLSSQDHDMWLRIAKQYKIDVVPSSLAILYKGHDDRISKSVEKKVRGKKQFIRKHKTDLKSHPEAMARHLKSLGIWLLYSGQSREARQYLMRSVKYDKRQLFTILYIFLTLLPKPIQNSILVYHPINTNRSG